MAQSSNTQADPQEVETARKMWHNFTVLAKYGIVLVAAVLLLMLMFVY